MVKVLSSFVRGPLEPYVTGFAEELLRQGYARSSAGQHVCFMRIWIAGCRRRVSGWTS